MSKKKRSKTWAQLNSYEVPKQLKHIKNEVKAQSELIPSEYKAENIISNLMKHIEKTITHKEISYAWWKLRKIGIENHEAWYNKTYSK